MDLDYFISIHSVYIDYTYEINQQINSKLIIRYLDKLETSYSINNNKLTIEFNKLNNTNYEFEFGHLIRLIKKLISPNIISNTLEINIKNYELIEKYLINLNNILKNDTNLCVGCGLPLEIKGTKIISCCNNNTCKQEFFSVPTDNRVILSYNKDPKVFEFLLQILLSGMSHPKGEMAFKPLPFVPNINNLNNLKEIISKNFNNTTIPIIYQHIRSSSNDLELFEKIGSLNYCILKNAVSDNYFSMSSKAHVSGDKKKVKKINPENSIEETKEEYETNIMFLNINYSAEVENKFPQKYYLFHGSSMYSWYPIVKNGLKIMSGTALQANGAVYGAGIYFSDSFEMSLGYSNRTTITNDSFPYSVVSVFEILKETSEYKKASGIFVINDESVLVLRYFVLVKHGSKLPKDITKTFISEIPAQKQLNKISVIMVKSKRLNAEHKKLSGEEFIREINIISEFSWIITFCDIKSKSIEIELKFSNYPLYPPDIKLISPKQIGSIADSEQNIKIPLTNPNTWEITNNLSQICLFLYNCFTETI